MSNESERLEMLVTELRELLAEPEPFAFPASVAPGELIESAWGNNVVQTLDYYDKTAGKWVTWGGAATVVTTAAGAFSTPLLVPAGVTVSSPPAITAICANPSFGIWIAYSSATPTTWSGVAWTSTGAIANFTFPVMFTAVAQRTG